MAARIAADAVLVLHLAFILFALLGAALAFVWRWMPWLHLPAAAWAVFVEATGRICPLTALEDRFRIAAGETGQGSSFVERMLLDVIYPDGLTREVQWVLAAIVLAVNALIYGVLVGGARVRRSAAHRTP